MLILPGTLTFNFKKSYRGVDHEQDVYSLIALGPYPTGWAGKQFDIHTTNVKDFPDPGDNPWIYTVAHDLAKIPILTEAEAAAHAPGPNYYDIVDFIKDPNHGRLFLRVEHAMPTPPTWNLQSSYDSYGEYKAALTVYQEKLDKWVVSVQSAGDAPVTRAELRDDGGLLGSVNASIPLPNNELLLISYHRTIVYGGAHNDTIQGGSSGSQLFGEAGNDKLIAGPGHQTLDGGPGNDTLSAGPGRDMLTGGANADEFDFDAQIYHRKGAQRDVITDFRHAQHDKIKIFDSVDPDSFVFIHHDTFAHHHALYPTDFLMVRVAGHIVQGTTDGKHVDFEIEVQGSVPHASDFMLS